MHASRNQSQGTAKPTTVCNNSHPDDDPKFAAFLCFSLSPPNVVNSGVSGLDRSLHTSNQQLAHNDPRHREQIAPAACAATIGDPICIRLAAKID